MIHLYPSVLWAIDSRAAGIAKSWYAQLDSDAKTFVRLAVSDAEMKSAVREFGFAAYSTRLRGLGVHPPEGNRVRVVVVAYAWDNESSLDWSRVLSELDALDHETLECNRTYILLGRTQEHEPRDSGVSAAHPPVTAWLVTDRLHRGERLDEKHFQRVCDLLFRGLLLAERQSHHLGPSVFRLPEKPGHVCLLALPGDDLDVLVERMADHVVAAVLFQARQATDTSEPIKPALVRAAEQSVRGLLAGELLPAAFLRKTLGDTGLGATSLHAMLADGPGHLRRLLSRVAEPSVIRAERPQLRWVQRVISWIGRQVGLVLEPPPVATRISLLDSERVYVEARLRLALDLLSGVARAGGDRVTALAIPAGLCDSLLAELHRVVREELRIAAGETEGNSSTVDSVVKRMMRLARAHVERNLAEAVTAWNIDDEWVRGFQHTLRGEANLRFTGFPPGGAPPALYAIAASSALPTDFPAGETVRYWHTAGFVMFGASEPLPVQFFNPRGSAVA